MPTIHPRYPNWSPPKGEKWRSCRFCGSSPRKLVKLKIESGDTEPSDGDLVTGGSSSATGYYLDGCEQNISGTWAGGDWAGWITLYSVSGDVAYEFTWGEAEETISWDTGSAKLSQIGHVILADGTTLHPESDMVKRDGHWYCIWHYNWYFRGKDRDDENKLTNISESPDREKEWK